MQVAIPATGEKYEAPDIKALERAVNEADAAWAADPGCAEKYEAWSKAIKQLTAAIAPEMQRLEEIAAKRRKLEALLADSLERGEREASDEYYEKFPPCEFDEVEPDPRFEDQAAAIADEHADASAFEQEARS